ncbi:hypothetical protein [Roseinatronobacter ekhonensis]|uniref:hypothetical protein n=1 Tax=Roseinatronobacter ekhonensis TaxID=254356 RepID=UPI000EB35F08|nr:hypothetical protein [Roseibaca ekhonensis]
MSRHALRAGRAGISHSLTGLSLAQIGLAAVALTVTYLGSPTGDLGCWIGFAGYALCAITAIAMLLLLLWGLLPSNARHALSRRDLVALVGLSAMLTVVAFVIHARSVAFCIGSV